ncbi:MAG: hypothetical protein Q9M92_15950 [Enterobacterales bacterium]|nr:hypothetical protein [Enterobacterales bacterium]
MKNTAGEVKNTTSILNLQEYIDLVEWAGKSIISQEIIPAPSNINTTLSQLNLQTNSWVGRVKYYGSHYANFVGKLELLQQKAQKLKKKWLKGFKPVKELAI